MRFITLDSNVPSPVEIYFPQVPTKTGTLQYSDLIRFADSSIPIGRAFEVTLENAAADIHYELMRHDLSATPHELQERLIFSVNTINMLLQVAAYYDTDPRRKANRSVAEAIFMDQGRGRAITNFLLNNSTYLPQYKNLHVPNAYQLYVEMFHAIADRPKTKRIARPEHLVKIIQVAQSHTNYALFAAALCIAKDQGYNVRANEFTVIDPDALAAYAVIRRGGFSIANAIGTTIWYYQDDNGNLANAGLAISILRDQLKSADPTEREKGLAELDGINKIIQARGSGSGNVWSGLKLDQPLIQQLYQDLWLNPDLRGRLESKLPETVTQQLDNLGVKAISAFDAVKKFVTTGGSWSNISEIESPHYRQLGSLTGDEFRHVKNWHLG